MGGWVSPAPGAAIEGRLIAVRRSKQRRVCPQEVAAASHQKQKKRLAKNP